MVSTEEFIRRLLAGEEPIKKENPKPGEKEYHYLDRRGVSDDTPLEQIPTIDVASPEEPNPALQTPKIQPQNQKQQTAANNDVSLGQQLAYASAAAAQGLAQGWGDEIYGVTGGLGYGIGALATGREDPWTAAKRGYIQHRNEARQYLKEANERAPITGSISNSIGSIVSPLNKLPINRLAPRHIQQAQSLRNAITGGAISGIGSAEGDINAHLAGMGIGSVGGALGYTSQKFTNKSSLGMMNDGGIKEIANNTVSHLGSKPVTYFWDEEKKRL